jgi:hypothetical protein
MRPQLVFLVAASTMLQATAAANTTITRTILYNVEMISHVASDIVAGRYDGSRVSSRAHTAERIQASCFLLTTPVKIAFLEERKNASRELRLPTAIFQVFPKNTVIGHQDTLKAVLLGQPEPSLKTPHAGYLAISPGRMSQFLLEGSERNCEPYIVYLLDDGIRADYVGTKERILQPPFLPQGLEMHRQIVSKLLG